jgi:SAM-dependent methyltransferase
MYAARIGNDAIGISYDERNNRVARERAVILGLANARFIDGDLRCLDKLAPSLGVFDQVLCLETIEHIRDDAALIRQLASILRPGGRILLTTPFSEHRPYVGERVNDVEDGGHVRPGYTHDELRALFDAAGLDVIHADFVTGFVSQLLVNVGHAVARVNTRLGWALVLPFRPLRVLDRPITRWLGTPYLCVAVLGQRRDLTPAPARDANAGVH